jgi:tRNA pseudouridine38-40 synthase
MSEDNRIILNTNFISEENTFFRYVLVIEYLGHAFYGSQKQPNVKTVQSELEDAIEQLLQRKTPVIFSGRTDKGVHAKHQTVHLNVPFELNRKRFLYSLNSVLSENICVKNIQQVDGNFHSQKSARFRWYRYTINNNPLRSVWLDKTASHIPDKLDVDVMQKALNYLVGYHDFTSFKGANSTNPTKDCHMFYANCKENQGIINIDLIANRFLYNMVRVITGTLIKIGRGIYPPEHMLRVLNARDRKSAGFTAEACGLTLMQVGYNEIYDVKMEINSNENLLCKAS